MATYAALAFTEPVKQLQQRYGSRAAYARQENHTYTAGLTEHEAAFLAERDSFYLASIGENGYPYVQHRGGPKGFLRVIDSHRLGFVDYTGNKQYISVGNLLTHPQVSVLLMDYPRRTRLKIYANARIVELSEEPALFAQLDPADYPHRPERMLVLTVQAYDWNCPQHITPRYTAEEVNAALAEQTAYVRQLEGEIARWRQQAADSPPAP
ncbi:pyridoxamine 5'-phosphate oxidase family protein [Hymenobacter terrenus]|uniref:pyridoxamine 5'-phosphate oxidase family protein n=1 Tax=Hymenobacter terrenus TaxID=1629124 RepID=UPI00061A000F|nr:pyridoxamine 5'-phosphate oxidase family protein [Hymenobacter terrenus]